MIQLKSPMIMAIVLWISSVRSTFWECLMFAIGLGYRSDSNLDFFTYDLWGVYAATSGSEVLLHIYCNTSSLSNGVVYFVEVVLF